MLLPINLHAGNDQRVGTAGAQELLINPWARSSGFGSANSASIQGLEASFLNIAGIAFTNKTEMIFSRTNWLVGSEIYVNAFGFSQTVGEDAVMALTFMSMDFGDIDLVFNPIKKIIDHSYLNKIEGLENPSSENLCKWIWQRLIKTLPSLKKIEIRETDSTGCIYQGE